ncbi:MAG: hypothetical protein ACFFFG_03395 [Candidatus Thorarchaeota archaeon]
MDTNDPKRYRAILKKENPETDIHNEEGMLYFQKKNLLFSPSSMDPLKERVYQFGDLIDGQIGSVRDGLRRKKVAVLQFAKKSAKVAVFLEPIDITPEYLLQEINQHQEDIRKNSLPGIVGTLIEKIGKEGQKIVREVGAVLESTSRELTQLTQATAQFIKESTQAANLLDSESEWSGKDTINLDLSEIDEILKRSLSSGKLDAIISGLMAKALLSAKDQRYKEARNALKIARDAAESAELNEYTELVEENLKELDSVEATEKFNPHLDEKALKYASEARDIVADWESTTEETEKDPI